MVAASSMPRLPHRNGCLKHLNTPLLPAKARKAVSDQKCTEVCSGCVLRCAMLVLIAQRKRVAFEKFKLATNSG